MYSCDIFEKSFMCRDIINGRNDNLNKIEELINYRFFDLENYSDYNKISLAALSEDTINCGTIFSNSSICFLPF